MTLLSAGLLAAGEPPAIVLASPDRAPLPVVVAPDTSESVREHAEILAEMLGRITGKTFLIEEGDGRRGVVLGTVRDFPDHEGDAHFSPDDPLGREDYLLRSHAGGLYVIGATEIGVAHAVWDLLYRLGHRQFFPTPAWEHVPVTNRIAMAVDTVQRPDYHNRRIWHGSHWYRADFDRWNRRNRAASGFQLSTGHAYRGIIRRNQEAFDEHPGFYALRDGRRENIGGNTKFCIANEKLRALVIADAVDRLHDDPEIDSISMDPSDGGNWCECADCAVIGPHIADRVVLLANAVAEAINAQDYGPKYVGMYAYGNHSPPPLKQRVHPKVIVSVATRYLREGYSAPELIEAWSERGAQRIGLREYYYGSGGLPNTARVADLTYLQRTLPRFHAMGARFNSANIGGEWGAAGFGIHVLARAMWDLGELDRVEALFDDFLCKAFGEAREPMAAFYRLLHRFKDGQRQPLLSEHLVGLMYRRLDEAYARTGDPAVIARLDDLTLYTRFVEKWLATLNATGDTRQQRYERWVYHGYRMADRQMVNAGRLHTRRSAPAGVTPVRDIDGLRERLRDAARDDEPTAIRAMVTEGIANNALLDFEPVEFSDDLIPAAEALALCAGAHGTGTFGHNGVNRSRREFLIWVDEPGDILLRVRGGITWDNRGPVNLTLTSPLEELEEPVASDDTTPPDGAWHEVILRTPFAGLHTLHVSDGDARHEIEFPDGMPVTLRAGFRPQVGFSLFFYVPRGTAVLGGYADSRYRGIYDADGRLIVDFEAMGDRGHFSVDVPEGQDGRLWFARTWRGRGELRLMTVPPYLARTPEELLLPREVVEADRNP